jgi:hypothetical protein
MTTPAPLKGNMRSTYYEEMSVPNDGPANVFLASSVRDLYDWLKLELCEYQASFVCGTPEQHDDPTCYSCRMLAHGFADVLTVEERK